MQNALRKAENALKKADPVIASLIDEHGPCLMFSDNSLVHRPAFHVLVWAIINQQLSVASAASIERKLGELMGSDTFVADNIKQLNDKSLAACGLSRQKIRYLRVLCESVISEQVDLDRISTLDNALILEHLSALPGIGPWTVDMYLMFSLGRLDVLPLGDLALRKSIAQHYNLGENPSHEEYHAVANNWRPYRTVSSWYLWAAVD